MKHRIAIAVAALMMIASYGLSAQNHMHHRPSFRPQNPAVQGFGLNFGYVHSSYKTTEWATDEKERSAGLDGFVIGVTKDFMLVPRTLYFQAGVNYIYQNDHKKDDPKTRPALVTRMVGDWTEHYLDIPVKIKYTYPLTYNIGLAAEFGPSFLMGLSSKMEYHAKTSLGTASASYNYYNAKSKVASGSETIDVGSWMAANGMLPEGKIRRFDVLLGASVGADFFDVLEVRLGYDWGLVNRYKGEVANDFNMKRGQFTLIAGVRF